MRIGIGYDVHKFAEDRKLILGGEVVEYHLGLAGHSDADVLVHAIMDAMLGALALGDIGNHFPDTDSEYKGADSLKLMERVNKLILLKGYEVENIDSVIICQKPKLATYIGKMRQNIADVLNVDVDCIGVKATTTEKLGFEGRGEGISSQAVALLRKKG